MAFRKKTIILIILLIVVTVLFTGYQFQLHSFNQRLLAQRVPSDSLYPLYGKNKLLPAGYEHQALIALSHYPELIGVPVEFQLLETITPLESRPTVLSTLFRRANQRHYLVLISTKSVDWLDEILLDKMPFDAQVGVLSHELAHTVNFVDRSFPRMVRVALGNLSDSYLNQFEYDTDQRTIDHGLGCELLQWSTYVYDKIPGEYKNGPERYMRPETILKKLEDRHEACK
jgi:hypothetical protein